MRISDWSSDVCSSDLNRAVATVNSTTGCGGPLSDPAKRAPAGLSDLCVAAAARDKAALGLGWRPGDEGDVVEALAVAEQAARLAGEIGRASCRERVWQDV